MTFTLRTITPDDLEQLDQLQQRYTALYPPRKPAASPMYISPYFNNGQNVLCAFDESATMLAFAPYFPQNDIAWVEVEALPGLEDAAVKDALFAWLMERARQDGMTKICFQYYPNETEAIGFVERQGAACSWNIYTMQRDLNQPIPDTTMPEGYTLRPWRMESEDEQRQYLEGRNESFPEAPTSLEEWQFFTTAPFWQEGVNMAAFSGETLAASVLVYFEPGGTYGSTEYVFTRAPYRGRGVARCLLAESLRYLKDHGLQTAGLEVKAENRSALGVYFGLGYEVCSESGVWEVKVS